MNFKVGTFFNVPLYINWSTFLVVFLLMSVEKVEFVALYVTMMFFVVLHEYGHCYAAQCFKWEVKDVTIYPVGGIASLQIKNNAKQELIMALAGPAVNVAILCLVIPLSLINDFHFHIIPLVNLFALVILSNVTIAAFNMLPVFPMDGGRVLRSTLSLWLGHYRGTFLAVRWGQVTGIALACAAVYFKMWAAGIIFMLMVLVSQSELTNAKILHVVDKIRKKLASCLNKPELEKADTPELIEALESLDEKTRDELGVGNLLPVLYELDAKA